MAIEVGSEKAICCRCATAYGKRRGNFPVSYAAMYKGSGYLPICKNCVETMYLDYLQQCNGDAKQAVRQMCRKLDLYWNEQIFDTVELKATTRTVMTNYMTRINSIKYAGKCYDDTLLAEGAMWRFDKPVQTQTRGETQPASTDDSTLRAEPEDRAVAIEDIPTEVIEYWGPGYTPDMYQDLEQRRIYWINNLPDGITPDVGMEALIRQICSLEIDINKCRADGRAPDKLINTLDKLISSMNLKPGQRGDEAGFEKTPYGVWIDRLEHDKPVPDVDPELSDVDGIIQKISIWFYGHASKMLGIKNMFCKLYEDKMNEYRIERAETDEDDDDEELFNRIFGGGDG